MISNDPADKTQPSSSPSGAEAGAAANSDECARKPIETPPTGNGPINDPSGSDGKPPTITDPDLFLLA